MKRRPVVVFIGAFGGLTGVAPPPGVHGGQLAACRGILESVAAQEVEWLLVDSTMASIPPPPLAIRARAAALRVARVLWLIATRQVDGLLIFTADGASFLEKGVTGMIGRVLGKYVVLAPRSGMLIDDLESGSWAKRQVWRALFRAPQILVCQSWSWAEYFSRKIGRDVRTMKIIRNGVRLLERSSGCRPPSAAKVTFLFMGWLEPFKGPQVLAAAFRLVAQRHPTARLRICGQGTMDRELRESLRAELDAGRVEFMGWVAGDDREASWQQADCLVLPSLREGAPNALLEAMERRLPVIGAAAGAIPDMLQNGELGAVVPPNDIPALASAMAEFVRRPERAAERARRARLYLEENHDLERTAEKWVALFQPMTDNCRVV